HIAGLTAHAGNASRHQVRPQLEIASGIADDGRLAGGSRGGVQPQHVFARHCEQAEGKIVAQLRFDGEGKADDVGEGLETVRLDACGIELATKRRDLRVGASDGLFEPMQLQRLERPARHRLGRAIEHERLAVHRARHALPRCAASRAAFAFSRSNVLAVSTTNRTWVPAPTSSSSSLTATSNDTFRRSTATTRTVISTVIPIKVGARCFTATSIPTESSPASACSRIRSRHVYSMSRIIAGVAQVRAYSPMKPMVRSGPHVMQSTRDAPGQRLGFIGTLRRRDWRRD